MPCLGLGSLRSLLLLSFSKTVHLLRNLRSYSGEGGNHESDVAGEPVLLPLTYPRCRGVYIVPGPNYIWSIDGHCTLDGVLKFMLLSMHVLDTSSGCISG